MTYFVNGLFLCNLVQVAFGDADSSLDPRIIGGQIATSVPWYVPLLRNDLPFCGGSIISEKWVLTAAHCVIEKDKSDFYVTAGVVDYFDRSNAQQRNIYAIHMHEDFDNTLLWNDIALLELDSPFCFNDYVARIDVATKDDPFEDGQSYSAAGWGRNDDGQIPYQLQELHGYPQYDQSACEEGFAAAYGFDLFDNLTQICVGGVEGEGICFGDSGGPLWMEVDSIPVLYGATSYVADGCANQYPSVFVRLSAYQDWIEARIGLTYSEFTDASGKFIVQGAPRANCKDATDPTCTARSVNQDELHNVRCCAETDPGGWRQNDGCVVYTNSKVPECYNTDWESAVEICDAQGARLCTKVELEEKCAAGGGCGYNSEMVWSSTPDTRFFIVKGNTGAKCLEESVFACHPRPVSIYEEWNVRCCADADPGGWLQNNGCSIYTQSQFPECVSTDWFSANHLCIVAGGRLCTREELESGCARDSGCLLNRKMVWSSTEYEADVECPH